MYSFLLLIVPLLYAAIQGIELSAVLARVAGTAIGQNMLGWSVQQSIYTATRLLLVLLLPSLGFLVDEGISPQTYKTLVHLSLFLSAVLGLLVMVLKNRFVSYYTNVIRTYKKTGHFTLSFFQPLYKETIRESGITWRAAHRKTLLYSIIVYTVYSAGIFIPFYFAIKFPQYRASISQMSGIVNASGTVLLTFFIEPAISKSIDERSPNAVSMILTLFLARLFSVAVTGQLVLLAVFEL